MNKLTIPICLLMGLILTMPFFTLACEQLSEVLNQAEESEPLTKEKYYVSTVTQPNRIVELRTIKRWEGEGEKEIRFKAEKSPWVVNGGYEATSQIASTFYVSVSKKMNGFEVSPMPFTSKTGIQNILVEETGNFTIRIKASGCNWWIKVGIE